MPHHSDVHAPVSTSSTARPGFIRFSDLEAHFQAFLIGAMHQHLVWAEVVDDILYVLAEFVHQYTKHDLDWSRSSVEDIPADALHSWYPFEKLTVHGQAFMIRDATDPQDTGVFAGKLFITKQLLEPYTFFGDSWLDEWPTDDELASLHAASARQSMFRSA